MIEVLTELNRRQLSVSNHVSATEGINSTHLYDSNSKSGPVGPYPILRVASARTVNKCLKVSIRVASTGEELGHFDIRYPVARQSFNADLRRPITDDDLSHGLELISDEKFEIAPGLERPLDAPHLVASGSGWDIDRSVNCQLSKASVSEIGWMEGCILEGLLTLPDFSPSKLHDRTLQFFEDFGHIQSIEGTLPAATLARLDPENGFIDETLELWEKHRDEAGIYSEGGRIVAESCLTVAYPMAVIAKLRSNEDMALTALAQLDHCTDALVRKNSIALRCFEDGQRVFKNWARGVGWYLLGHAKAIRELQGWVDTSSQLEALGKTLKMSLKFQRPNGLWGSFIDDPSCIADTSGSAIIAVAAAIYAQFNSTSAENMKEKAILACGGLEDYLSTDGLLGGATQHNCGGEELQRGNYRVSHPYALALYAELRAQLHVESAS